MDGPSVLFRSTYRTRFDYGACWSKVCSCDGEGEKMELVSDDSEDLIKKSFGPYPAWRLALSVKRPEMADDIHKPCLYVFAGENWELDEETTVNYRMPSSDKEFDDWGCVTICKDKVFKVEGVDHEDVWVVARMYPEELNYGTRSDYDIYFLVPWENATKSLRKLAKLSELG